MATAHIQQAPRILIHPSEWSYTGTTFPSTTPTTSPPPVRTSAHRQPPPVPSRKIRFAPLPTVLRDCDDNGDEIAILDTYDPNSVISSSPATAPLDLSVLDTSSLSSFGSSKRNSDTDPSTTPGTTTPASTPSDYNGSRSASPSGSPIIIPQSLPNSKDQYMHIPTASKAKGLGLFRSFKRASTSSNSLTPTPSIDRNGASHSRRYSAGSDTFSLNIFRTASKDTTHNTDLWNLTRWTSTQSTHSSRRQPLKEFGAPLSRTQSTQSTQSYRSKTPSLFSGLRPSSAPGRSSKPPANNPHRKGTRMLNGRVYGGRRLNPNANLFANAPDAEPEFVEWGYGGMGSVKGAKSAGAESKWERLHGAQDEDLDDGGGMAWIKKRREERERKAREAKEKEEKEAAEAAARVEGKVDESESNDEPPGGDAVDFDSSLATPVPMSTSAMPTPRPSSPDAFSSNPLAKASSISVNTHHSNSTAVPASPTLPSIPISREVAPVNADDSHVFTTMAIPMPRPHHRPRSNTRDGRDAPISPLTPLSPDEKEKTFLYGVQVVESKKSPSSSGSYSDSDESDSDREDYDDDEEDEEDEQEAQRRAMVIGAGMEKISRRGVEENHA